MPLPMKTIREAAAQLGMPENEIKAMIDLKKIRAVLKNGVATIAPDEMGRLQRMRKTLPPSAQPTVPKPAVKPPASRGPGVPPAKGPAAPANRAPAAKPLTQRPPLRVPPPGPK